MKVSFLLIILGFSQVLGRNYGSLTESKSEREDRMEGKSNEDNNIEMGVMCRARHCYQQWKSRMGKFSILGIKSLLPFKAKIFQKVMFFHHHFYLPEENIQVQNGHGVLRRLVPYLKCMKIAY